MNNKQPQNSNKQFLLRYASLGSQLIAALGLAVFAGLKADDWLNLSPLLACLLPVLTLAAIFYKLMRETKPNKDEK